MRKDRFDDIDDVGIDWWQLGLVVMFILMAVGILAGCRAKYVTVPEYHKEYIVRSDTIARVDSVLLHDSVFVYHSGDTIIVNKVAYRDRVRNVYKTRTDTIVKTDSVRVPYPVEAQLSKAQQRYISLGKAMVWAVALLVVVLLAFLARRMIAKRNQ